MALVDDFGAAGRDFASGWRLAPLWSRLGLEQTVARYRRTLLGPFWLASSTIATGIALTVVFGAILGGNWRQNFPFVLAGITAWTLVGGMVNDGVGAFTGAAGTLQVIKLPLTFHAYLQLTKTLINFSHQIIGFWALMALFRTIALPHWQLIPALLLVTVTGLFVSIPVGMIATRYRDIGFLTGFVMQTAFMLTPVFWRRAQMPPHLHWIVDFNPFAHLLEVLRQPLLGHPAELNDWTACIFICLCASLIAFVSVMLFRRRVVFWL